MFKVSNHGSEEVATGTLAQIKKAAGIKFPAPSQIKSQVIMRKVNAVIEKASDGNYSIYMNADDMPYLVTGTGKTVKEAKKVFEDGYEDIKKYYEENGEPFEEVEFCYQYDIPSFLQEYAYLITLSGLERVTGVNQKQLGHYISGFRHPSAKTAKKIEEGIRKLGQEFSSVKFA